MFSVFWCSLLFCFSPHWHAALRTSWTLESRLQSWARRPRWANRSDIKIPLLHACRELLPHFVNIWSELIFWEIPCCTLCMQGASSTVFCTFSKMALNTHLISEILRYLAVSDDSRHSTFTAICTVTLLKAISRLFLSLWTLQPARRPGIHALLLWQGPPPGGAWPEDRLWTMVLPDHNTPITLRASLHSCFSTLPLPSPED